MLLTTNKLRISVSWLRNESFLVSTFRLCSWLEYKSILLKYQVQHRGFVDFSAPQIFVRFIGLTPYLVPHLERCDNWLQDPHFDFACFKNAVEYIEDL